MATHLLIRDGSLIPIAGTSFSRNGTVISFILADGSAVTEVYSTGEADAIAAFAIYSQQVMGTTPLFLQLVDKTTGALSVIAVYNGKLKVTQ